MKYTLSGRLWKEGCELVNSNKVKKQKQTTQADGTPASAGKRGQRLRIRASSRSDL